MAIDKKGQRKSTNIGEEIKFKVIDLKRKELKLTFHLL